LGGATKKPRAASRVPRIVHCRAPVPFGALARNQGWLETKAPAPTLLHDAPHADSPPPATLPSSLQLVPQKGVDLVCARVLEDVLRELEAEKLECTDDRDEV